MNRAALIAFALLAMSPGLRGASTINSTNAFSYGANVGWMNWRAGQMDGISIGEYICSGYLYGANVGWISVGNGNPANHIQYQNNSATDFGVNYSIDPASPGQAILRGYGYGANIGWINFEATGNPRLRFSDGRLQGYAYSANLGWINLGDGSFAVQTDYVASGVDTDGDGIADAFEWSYFGGLAPTATSDSDGDGISDLQEYLNGTAPNSPTSGLRITAFSTTSNGTSSSITWTSTAARLYKIETTSDLIAAPWTPDPNFGISFAPDPGVQTTRNPVAAAGTKRFYRVRAVRPLAP